MSDLKEGLSTQEILDNGYVKFIESWGSDERIIESARMSTNGAFKGWDKDRRFLSFLWRNKHSSPFEMAGMTIEVHAPIMVFREWHRHRTQSYNEMSARYIPMPDEHYVPDLDNIFERAKVAATTKNKQAQAQRGVDVVIDITQLDEWLISLERLYRHSQECYEQGLAVGVPKEVARLSVTVARYSKMRASANLRNWLGFMMLRLAPNAQWEIRQYAQAVARIISDQFPRTYEDFTESFGDGL